MINMYAVPKPPKTKTAAPGPKLTEEDFIEIGERIAEAMEYSNEVEITIYHRKQSEEFAGVITSANSQTGTLSLRVNNTDITIHVNSIVGIK